MTTATATCPQCQGPVLRRGVPGSPAKYCSDKCRRQAHVARTSPPCPECGAKMDYRAQTCQRCKPILWTRETIIEAIQEYADRYGHPPSAHHWNPPMAIAKYRDDLAERFHTDGCWPYTTVVQSVFGTWNNAIDAAGFTPLKPGHKYGDQPQGAEATT